MAPPRRPGGGRPPGPPRLPGPGGWPVLLIVALSLAGLLVGGAAIIFLSMPTGFIRDQIVAQVKASTGRDLTVGGATSFTLYPALGLSMEDVSLSVPPGMSGDPFVRTKSLTARIALIPLLSREVKVIRLVLQEPVFNLSIDKNGNRSWEFSSASDQGAGERREHFAAAVGAKTSTPTTAGKPVFVTAAAGGSLPLEDLTLEDVRIVNGKAFYRDASTDTSEVIDAVTMSVSLPSIRSALSAKGQLTWRGEALGIDASAGSLAEILSHEPTDVIAGVEGRPASIRYEGKLGFAKGLDADGDLAVQGPSLTGFASWLRGHGGSAVQGGVGAFEIKGKLRASASTYTLSGASATLDNTRASGDMALTTGGPRPIVKANLKVARLDLEQLLEGSGAARGTTPAGQSKGALPSAPAGQPAAKGEPTSIEDILRDSTAPQGPRVKGFVKRAGWSEEPLDLEFLSLADVDAKLAVTETLYKKIKIGQSSVKLALKNSVLQTSLERMSLYEGTGNGLVTVDATTARSPNIAVNLNVDGIGSQQFLADAAEIDWLAGKGKLSISVSGQGGSQRQIMDALLGTADLRFTDGAIVGINIAGLLRNIGQGNLAGLKSAPTEKTDFSSFTSTWKIAGGIAENSDLNLLSPLLRVTGDGKALIGEQRLDYTLRPKLVASLTGQGGETALSGLEIPVKVEGPWGKPKFAPDLKGILNDPDKAVDQLKEIGKKLKGKSAGDLLKGILGNGEQQGTAETGAGGTATGTPEEKKPTAKDLLEGLFKK